MNECKHEFFRMSEFGELFCDACCESQSKIVADMLVDSDTKLSEARADALRMAQVALSYIKKEIGTIKSYEGGHGSYAAGLDGVSAEEIIAKYEEK